MLQSRTSSIGWNEIRIRSASRFHSLICVRVICVVGRRPLPHEFAGAATPHKERPRSTPMHRGRLEWPTTAPKPAGGSKLLWLRRSRGLLAVGVKCPHYCIPCGFNVGLQIIRQRRRRARVAPRFAALEADEERSGVVKRSQFAAIGQRDGDRERGRRRHYATPRHQNGPAIES